MKSLFGRKNRRPKHGHGKIVGLLLILLITIGHIALLAWGYDVGAGIPLSVAVVMIISKAFVDSSHPPTTSEQAPREHKE
jgi:membrane glycosyltransferase